MAQIYIPPVIRTILRKKNYFKNLPIVKNYKLKNQYLNDYIKLYIDDFGLYCNDADDNTFFEWLKRLYQKYLNNNVLFDDGIQRNADCCFSSGAWLDEKPWKNKRGWKNNPS